MNRNVFLGATLGGVVMITLACGGGSSPAPDASPDALGGPLDDLYPMAVVEPGTYTIGCKVGAWGGCEEGENLHEVTLTRRFAIGKTEVPQSLYTATTKQNPSEFIACPGSCPVENISWYDAVAFANMLSEEAGLESCYEIDGEDVTWPNGLDCKGFRLPTEAEWAVAANGGEQTRYAGATLHPEEVAWFIDNAELTTHSVGSKAPNEWGIFDMNGNVSEWCFDGFKPYTGDAQVDPMGGSDGSRRAARGGNHSSNQKGIRNAQRYRFIPTFRKNYMGLRLVRTL